MKINSVNSFYNLNLYGKSNKKNHNHQNITNQFNNKTCSMPGVDTLKAYNKINFGNNLNYLAMPRHDRNQEIIGVNISIPFSDDENIMLALEATDNIDILFNEDNSINSDAMDLFISLYKQIYGQRRKDYEKEVALYKSIIEDNKTNNKYSFDPDADIQNAMDACKAETGLEWAKNFLNGVQDKNQRDELAYMYLDLAQESCSEAVLVSAQIALGVLKLSKTQNGFETTELDKKIKIIQNVYSLDNSGKALDEFIRISKEQDGNINFDAMLKATNVLYDVMMKALETSSD